MGEKQRIGALDLFRAIAVLWVLIFHFAYFFTPAGPGQAIVPFGSLLADFPLVNVGALGVNLFFLISGYVISLTLTRTDTLRDFAVKRVARLWPTLVFCGTLTFIVAWAVRVDGLTVSLWEYLISIMFIPPEQVGKLIGHSEWMWLDSAYWSLWVEVRFYAVIGVLFYAFRKNWFGLWVLFQCVGFGFFILQQLTGSNVADLLEGLVFSVYAPYFTIGIIAYLHHTRGMSWFSWMALVIAIAHILVTVLTTEQRVSALSLIGGYTVVTILFGVFTLAPDYASRFKSKTLLAIGRSSYSLYLLHQVIGLSLFAIAAKHFTGAVSVITLPIIMALLALLSNFVFKIVEQPSNRWVVKRFLMV